MKELIFASKNKGKIYEVRSIFSDTEFKITSLIDLNINFDIDESADTFEENAKIKAREVYDKFKIPVIADDSGISVEQLNGRPGVFSARYAGENATDEDNNNKLIEELKKYNEPHNAKYVCCAVYYDGVDYKICYGEIKGKITMSPRGNRGFGYDPLFIPEGYKLTMAELELEEKNRISHRAIAFNKLKEKLNQMQEKI
jgi:XTP/dITP diphosphohydrolase